MTKAEYIEKAGNEFADKIRSLNLNHAQLLLFNKIIQPKFQEILHLMVEVFGEEKSIELQEFYLEVNKKMFEIGKMEKK